MQELASGRGDGLRVGIMQPYFFPYIGYWQLMNAVDKYVIYDDVNYIKGGWINRNRILVNDEPKYFNLPLVGASPNKLINQVMVNNDSRIINKNLRIIKGAYGRAPYFEKVYPIIERILTCGEQTVSGYLASSIKVLCEYLCIRTDLILSSSLHKDSCLKGQAKVIAICKETGATEYYNAIGGMNLYNRSDFEENGVKLFFIKTGDIKYEQYGNAFRENLSIIDVMMFCAKEQIQGMLNIYEIL